MLPSPTSNNANSAQGSMVSFRQNAIQQPRELDITIVAGASGAASNLLIMPGPNPLFLVNKLSCAQCDHTNQTIASTVSLVGANGYAELKNFLLANSFKIDYIRITTDNTNLYNAYLIFGESSLSGYQSPQKIALGDYATVIGGGGSYDKNLKIPNFNMINSKTFYMYLSAVPASTTFTITFGIKEEGNTAPLTPVLQ